jgi:hypothetical protein
MKQKKIAISLAVVGAIAAPFVLGTYKMQPEGRTWEPNDAEFKANLVARMESTNNCQELVDKAQQSAENSKLLWMLESCRLAQKALNERGMYVPGPSTPLKLALNVAAAAVGFGVIFGMTYLLPALARRYWRWLNT